MKVVQQISLLALALTLASCNEKVSPELQNASVTTGGATSGSTSGSGSGTTGDVTYSFKLTNTADIFYNMNLHKTGPGNAAAACEVKSTNTPFSNASFGDSAVNDITCYLDAEELSLAYNGPKFKIEATANTCDFVTYKPFYYYNRQPGDSTGTYKYIKCMNDDTTNAHVATLAASIDPTDIIKYDPDGAGAAGLTNAGCGDYLSTSTLLTTPSNVRGKFTVNDPNDASTLETESLLCRFNYDDGDKEKCDIGKITIEENQVTYDKAKAEKTGDDAGKAAAAPLITTYSDTTDNDAGGPDDGTATIVAAEQTAIDAAYNAAYTPAYNSIVPTVKKVSRSFMCGGKVSACVKGPMTTHSELSTTKPVLYISGDSKNPVSKEFTYPSIIGSDTTVPYVNFRRDLASNIVDYISSTDPGYAAAFIDQKVFDPKAVEQYSMNMDYDGTVNLIGTAFYNANATEALTFSARPLAADAFLGLSAKDYQGNLKSYPTNPFYTFECLDTAREPKARIRLVVREWDRIFPNGLNAPNTELLTDIYFDNSIPANVSGWSRQDNTVIDPHSGVSFNNYVDWDDLIGYQKTSIPPYYFMPVNGFFKKNNFPNLATPE